MDAALKRESYSNLISLKIQYTFKINVVGVWTAMRVFAS